MIAKEVLYKQQNSCDNWLYAFREINKLHANEGFFKIYCSEQYQLPLSLKLFLIDIKRRVLLFFCRRLLLRGTLEQLY